MDNTDDVIDSRDVIERAAELAARWVGSQNHPKDGCEPLSDEEREELDSLSDLIDAGKDYAPDWEYGATLIRDSYFKDYAMELAEDIGALNTEAGWPAQYIDWDRASEALQQDCTSIDFDGITYWVR